MEKILLGKWVAMLNRATQMHINNQLGQEGIGAGQYPFLLFIGRCSGCSQDEIARNLCFDKGTTARALKKLENQGFITRNIASSDHRRHEVSLTHKGRQMRLKVRKLLEVWHNRLLADVPEEVRNLTAETLQKMAHNAIFAVKDINLDTEVQES